MPYQDNSGLPASVKNHLPLHAQDIYRQAFNSAWEKYAREDTAHRVAWAAVKLKYRKDSPLWVEKE